MCAVLGGGPRLKGWIGAILCVQVDVDSVLARSTSSITGHARGAPVLRFQLSILVAKLGSSRSILVLRCKRGPATPRLLPKQALPARWLEELAFLWCHRER